MELPKCHYCGQFVNPSKEGIGGRDVYSHLSCDGIMYFHHKCEPMEETPKQKAIREAYGQYWEGLKDHVNPDGWVLDNNVEGYPVMALDRNGSGYDAVWRPVSLAGIEDNNGWTRVDERLPKGFDVVIALVGNIVYNARFYSGNEKFEDLTDESVIKGVTHWRPLEKYHEPIY